jgi:hypothetical protein
MMRGCARRREGGEGNEPYFTIRLSSPLPRPFNLRGKFLGVMRIGQRIAHGTDEPRGIEWLC